MKRSDGERERLKHSIARLRAVIDAIETTLDRKVPAGEGAQVVLQTAGEIAMQLSKYDAYVLCEEDPVEPFERKLD